MTRRIIIQLALRIFILGMSQRGPAVSSAAPTSGEIGMAAGVILDPNDAGRWRALVTIKAKDFERNVETGKAGAFEDELPVPKGTYYFTAQAKKTAPNSAGVPKPPLGLTAGTWKYKETYMAKVGGTDHSTYSVTIKDDGAAWTVTTAMEFSDGPVTDVSTLEKGTLVLLKESFKHFAHQGQPWKPVAINLDFTGNKVTGTMKYVSGPDKPVAVDLGGPLFADPAGWMGCLPLTNGYATTFRYFDIDRFALNPQASNKIKLVQLRVVGMEPVTVLAGTFDSYEVELTSADGGSNKETVWIAKDLRMPVKASTFDELYGVITTELVP